MEPYYSEKGPHPVWKIWLKTQEVIAERISNTSKKQMFMLLVIYGLAFSLDNASIRNMGERHEFPILLIVCAIVAPLAGLFTWFIGSAVLHGMSRLLGGTGSFKETRTALAWATVVYSAKLVIWVPQLLLYGRMMFTEQIPAGFLLIPFLLLSLLDTVLSIWYIVVVAKSMAEAHRLPLLRGFGTVIIPVALIILFRLIVTA